jgi:hypothetical protein
MNICATSGSSSVVGAAAAAAALLGSSGRAGARGSFSFSAQGNWPQAVGSSPAMWQQQQQLSGPLAQPPSPPSPPGPWPGPQQGWAVQQQQQRLTPSPIPTGRCGIPQLNVALPPPPPPAALLLSSGGGGAGGLMGTDCSTGSLSGGGGSVFQVRLPSVPVV